MLPRATYRLQLTPSFTLRDAKRTAGYLHDLGVSHVYLSPVFEARSGSEHGYDVTDPTRIRREIGGRRAFDALTDELSRRGMGLVLDIVPNHMAVSEENPWLRDVMRRGRTSRYAPVFDIDWEAGGGELILPVLGEPGPDRVEGATRKVYWKTGLRRLNYRRFFNISDLIGVRVEDDEVFERTHALIFELVRSGQVQGLRVDHIDGLVDPAGYLRRLRERVGERTYVIVEKILGEREELRRWPVDGTTGYVFANVVNGVFVEPWGADALESFLGGGRYSDEVYAAKKQILKRHFAGEIERLVSSRWQGDSRPAMKKAVTEVTACMPVYRTYIRGGRVSDADRRIIRDALRHARRRAGIDTREIAKTLLLSRTGRGERRRDREFVARWQQLTGAVMAKGVEDTAYYRYDRLASLNEVGGERHPPTTGDFHRLCARRRGSLNATSTHDTMRSEDVRARIDVLSEISDDWKHFVRRWLPGAPDRSLGHLCLQTLAGAWPLDARNVPGFRERLEAFMIKAARESKTYTSWIEPDHEFERRVARMVGRFFERDFLRDFLPVQRTVALVGALNSLSQLTLKLCAPGVPDIYQGTELWDFSLVDPDNRRPVDYRIRARRLDTLDRSRPGRLLESWSDGGIKLLLTATGLHLRRRHRKLLAEGRYQPLMASGRGRRHVVAFSRRDGRRWLIAAAPRFVTRLVEPGELPVGGVWGNSRLDLPRGAPKRWRNALTGATHDGPLELRTVMGELPFAILVSG